MFGTIEFHGKFHTNLVYKDFIHRLWVFWTFSSNNGCKRFFSSSLDDQDTNLYRKNKTV